MTEERDGLLAAAQAAAESRNSDACARLAPRLSERFSEELMRMGKARLARRLEEMALSGRTPASAVGPAAARAEAARLIGEVAWALTARARRPNN